ncbi:MAG: sigma-70 family RNA polymerase sigma factor [Clostridia bacterium]|nr:sigma-70 family RNA polymerase sigma factor [Clostridia bacterium]
MENEQNLIEKSKKGDADAFSELILAYEKKIISFTYRMLGNTEDAEDAAQEVFVKAYRAISGFDGKSSFKTWLYKIASNVAMDELRKRKRRNSDKTISLYTESEDGEYELPLSSEKDEPFEEARKNELQKVLQNAIGELKDEYRLVVVMRDVQNISYEDIAKTTGLSLGTVKSRISRGRLSLKKILEKNRELFLQ